jgi:signal peptidase I
MIFVLRSFFFEPFGIPSSSMLPTLHSGDLVLVNKFTYGIRLPIINKKVIEVNDPQRGDVVVFRYPRDISQNFVKRIIGVPGDHITYQDKRLTVNGQTTAYTPLNDYWVPAVDVFKQLSENLAGVQHRVLNTKGTPTLNLSGVYDFAHKDACSYLQDGSGFTCMVPAENYFMMGDNRDHSADSRYWGFVPDKNIVGKAFFVWMTLGKLSHIGSIE